MIKIKQNPTPVLIGYLKLFNTNDESDIKFRARLLFEGKTEPVTFIRTERNAHLLQISLAATFPNRKAMDAEEFDREVRNRQTLIPDMEKLFGCSPEDPDYELG